MEQSQPVTRRPGRPAKPKAEPNPAMPVSDVEREAILEAERRQIDMDDTQVGDPVTRTTRIEPPRTPTRDVTRQTARSNVVMTGRNGEELSRSRNHNVDQFHIDPAVVPKNWTYQWNTISVLGNKDVALNQQMRMHEQGWRPVPAERHPGRYMPIGVKGEIIRDGLRLEERPTALTNEARAEELADARSLVADSNESFGPGSVKGNLPQGFEMSGKYRGTGGDIRMQIDPALDIPRPDHKVQE